MNDEKTIALLAKMLTEKEDTIEYYRERCDKLETELRLRDNTTETNDDIDLQLTPEGAAAKARMQEEPHAG